MAKCRTSQSDVQSNMAARACDSLESTLAKERLAIWRTHGTEEARQLAWSERRAQVVSYLFNDASTPRSFQQELGGPLLAMGSGLAVGLLLYLPLAQ